MPDEVPPVPEEPLTSANNLGFVRLPDSQVER